MKFTIAQTWKTIVVKVEKWQQILGTQFFPQLEQNVFRHGGKEHLTEMYF
jgi:hypothetical protein